MQHFSESSEEFREFKTVLQTGDEVNDLYNFIEFSQP